MKNEIDELPDFGVQHIGYEDPHPWLIPLLGSLAWGAFMLMCLLGKAPWQ